MADSQSRLAASGGLGIPDQWAWMTQVHGSAVLEVSEPGLACEGDGLFTGTAGLPRAVRTADCVPVVVHAETAVAVVHAGWRGMAAGVIAATLAAMERAGHLPVRAAIGPSIGPCCYEVGEEVVAALGGRATTTGAGSTSVDLWSGAESQLGELPVWRADLCTHCEGHFHSYRATGTALRQTTVGWL
ncbi:MAG: polyphenol oxidase family protein [Acidimicrobiia bacterium]